MGGSGDQLKIFVDLLLTVFPWQMPLDQVQGKFYFLY
jgi:hypothetical protein